MALNVIKTTTPEAYDRMYNDLEAVVGSALYPGDERLIFAKAILLSKAQEYAELNAAARQTWLDYAYGEYLDAIGKLLSVDRTAANYARCKVKFFINNGQYEGTAPVGSNGAVVFTDVLNIVNIPSIILYNGDTQISFDRDSAVYSGASQTLSLTVTEQGISAVSVVVKYAYPEEIDIPAGTMVTSDSRRYFVTLVDSVLMPGDIETPEITAQADERGADYNGIKEGAINTVVNLYNVPFIPDVRNVTETSGGDDAQSDDVFREAIRIAPNKTTTAGPEGSYKYWTMQADARIKDVYVISPYDTTEADFPDMQFSINYVAGMTGTPGEVFVYPLCENMDTDDPEYDIVIERVVAMLNKDNIRPLTDTIHVIKPYPIDYKFEIKYYVTSEYAADAEGAVAQAVDDYISWQSDKMGRDINPDRLRLLVLAVDGVQRVDVSFRVYTYDSESEEWVWTDTTYHEIPVYAVAHNAAAPEIDHAVIDDGEVYQ